MRLQLLYEDKWDEGKFSFTSQGIEIGGTVRELVRFIADKGYPIKTYDVQSLPGMSAHADSAPEFVEINVGGKWSKLSDLSPDELEVFRRQEQEDIMSSDLKYPIIVAERQGNPLLVIDGNHRLEKAIKMGKSKIRGYGVPEDDLFSRFKSYKRAD